MRKLLLLIFALLGLGVSGAWAATTPATGAYPEVGKTYYLFANNYGSTDRYYLYWDNTNSVLKRATANSKENNSYYKWTVTISDGKYYITNVGTSTKLAWDGSKGLTLNAAGTLFDLSKQVHYTACVSLYNPSGFWCCVQNSSETFASGLKFSSFPNDTYSASYSLDFVFEEVLSAHSLTDGSYYTIYCDNDNKQYLYDNAGTLAQTSSAPASDLRYVWQCIVSGDYYNFRNLQTGKYLSHKAISSSANNFTIETTNVYHEGCAKLKTNSTYMGFKTAGAPDQASASTFSKITTDFSYDFRFDAIDLSSWCTGDLLGGSISGSDNWTNTWTSGTSPSFTLTASANNINHKNDRTTGGLDIRSGQSTTSTYTITAPTGYLVTGYKIVGYALNGDQTVTPSKGGDATIFKTTGNSISVSGLRQGKASFTLSGANDGLFIRALQVSLAPIPSSITSLPTANNKTYIIYNARAAWNFADGATSMNAVALDLDDEGQQIALIYKNENYYLYSVNAGKYLTADNTLTSVVTDNEQISITATGNATYPWFFSFKNVASKNINIDGNPTVRINSHSTLDDGNQNAIVEVGDFDATEALAIFDNRYVTYNLSYGGNSTFRTENNVVVAIGGDPADYVPESWKAAYCTLTYDVETIEESTTTVNVTATWNGPFDISADFNTAKWYYLKVNGKWAVYGNFTYNSKLITQPYDNETNAQNAIAKSMWAFVGNPYDGFEIMNRHAGSGMYLNSQSGMAMYMSNSNEFTTFKIAQKEGNTFSMNNGGYYINCGDSYIAANSGVSGNASSSLTVEDIPYKFLALAYLPEYAASHHMGQYFGVDENSYNSVMTTITNATSITENVYNDLVSNINNYLSPRLPETGYYRIKSSGSRGDQSYITYGYLDGSKGTGLLTTIGNKETDLGTVVKLTRVGTSKNYIISIQGLNVQAHSGDNTLFRATGAEGLNFQFNHINFSGMCSIYDGTNHGNMHEADWKKPDTGLNGVVGWDAGDGTNASSWCLEDASTIEVTLNNGGDGFYYATCFTDFPVSYTGASNGEGLFVLTGGESNGKVTAQKVAAVPAQQGFLIRLAAENVTDSKVTLTIPASAEALTGTNVLTGTCLATTKPDGNVYVFSKVGDDLGFFPYTGSDIPANRAYIVEPAGSGTRSFILSFDETTGLNGVSTSTPAGTIFDMQGRRVNKAEKGLYIVNGKKVLF